MKLHSFHKVVPATLKRSLSRQRSPLFGGGTKKNKMKAKQTAIEVFEAHELDSFEYTIQNALIYIERMIRTTTCELNLFWRDVKTELLLL